VKQKIQAEHNLQADLMKLIAYGKVMEDDNKNLKDYSIKEGDFLVVMISKVFLSLLNQTLNSPSPNLKLKLKIKRWKMCLNNRIPHNSNSNLQLSSNSNNQQPSSSNQLEQVL